MASDGKGFELAERNYQLAQEALAALQAEGRRLAGYDASPIISDQKAVA